MSDCQRLTTMSNMCFRSIFATIALLLCGIVSYADSSSVTPPPSPAPFSITLHVADAPGKDYFDLDNPNSSFDIIVKNISSKPRYVGFLDCALQITAINGCKLSSPCHVVAIGAWSAYAAQLINPGEETDVHFLVSYLPRIYQVIPNRVYQMLYNQGKTSILLHNDQRLVSAPFLPRLAGFSSSRFETITAFAVCPTFVFDKRFKQSISAPITFKTGL